METHIIIWIVVSLCAGCLAVLELNPVTDPVIGLVGGSVLLEIKPPGPLGGMIWMFGPEDMPVVSWAGSEPEIDLDYKNRVTLNTKTGSLQLKPVSLNDSGVYTFEGTVFMSAEVQPFKGSVTVTVHTLIGTVIVNPNPEQPIENQALNLTCEVLGSKTVSSRLWLKDGQPLSTSDRITLSVDNSTVSFNPVLQSDNGEYQCKAKNPVIEVASPGYILEVNYGPEQASITGPDSAAEGSSVTFTCSAQSLPPCNYTWYFNGADAVQGSQYKIASVSNADSGSYTCVAWNSVTGRNTSAVKEFNVTESGSGSGSGCLKAEIAQIAISALSGIALLLCLSA
ncbi:carcinoembryonic antigen-related cell adhesion molecule 1-like [Huso huso]|uniref:Carcinoembryonic antigen-related cell adhesion molecule 1-like n=1 Tax=Huso huso TaxID=61971 RepID=A0ABR0YAT2_HUSHU